MNEIFGPSNRVLEVDLTKRSFTTHTVSELERREYLGGKGLGLKLLNDRMLPGTDPLAPENIVAVMPGVLMGTGAPCTGRFATVTKSPLTGIYTSSSCGGPFGMALKTAGWDGLLIKGCADSLVYLVIDHEGVRFEDATLVAGLDTQDVQAKLCGQGDGALAIGPAGENLVLFANVASGQRYLGRGGVGAVFGSKRLKAVVARGGRFKIRPRDFEDFEKLRKRATEFLTSNKTTAEVLRNFGTAGNTPWAKRHNMMPVNNFQDGTHERMLDLSGQSMAPRHGMKPHTCKPCTILCGHRGRFAGGKELPVPEFETVGLLGSNLGIFDTDLIAEWNEICSRLGMDTISAGGTLAWVMEAGERGLVQTGLRFGKAEGIADALEQIAYGEGFGREMGQGSRALSRKYGGEEFAIHVKGLEMSAYDPRGAFGQGLSYAVANRGGCHLSAYPVALEAMFDLISPHSASGKAEWTAFLENVYACINSLHTCLFTSFGYIFESPLTKRTPDIILGKLMQYLPSVAIALTDVSLFSGLWSSVTGIPMSRREFIEAGERIHVLERTMNTREGISRKDDTLPGRMLKEARKSDVKGKTIPLGEMLDRYYQMKGYDDNGIPTGVTLRRLKLL
ncbi:aldehyde ferredoxin oxidoreductase [Geomonas sp. Red276]